MNETDRKKLKTELLKLTGEIAELKVAIEQLQKTTGQNYSSLPFIQKAIPSCDRLSKILNQLPLNKADMAATQKSLLYLAADLDSDLSHLARNSETLQHDKVNLLQIHARVESLQHYAKVVEKNFPKPSALETFTKFARQLSPSSTVPEAENKQDNTTSNKKSSR